MGQTLDQAIAELPAERRERVELRHRELKQEVEGFRELRKLVGEAQVDVASVLNIKQRSVSRIEKHLDVCLSTLRGYVEAAGGKLELIVKLPGLSALRVNQFRDVAPDPPPPRKSRSHRRTRSLK